MKQTSYEDKLMELKSFFDPYLEKKFFMLNFKKIQKEFKAFDIQTKIRELSKAVRGTGYYLTTPFAKSFAQNMSQFLKLNRLSNIEYVSKWRVLGHSYLSFVSSIEAMPAFNKYCENKNSDKKAILAISMMYPDEDDILVNKEIDHISTIYHEKEDFFVLPIHGCTFKVFKSILELQNFDIMHIAGHGDVDVLGFVSRPVRNTIFMEEVSLSVKQMDLCFLNCCESYTFVNQTNVNFANYTISHNGDLASEFAILAAQAFHELYSQNKNVKECWNIVEPALQELYVQLLNEGEIDEKDVVIDYKLLSNA